MNIYIDRSGVVRHIYQDATPDLPGQDSITRFSHVEPIPGTTQWSVEIIDPPQLFTGFATRGEALAFEVSLLEERLKKGLVQ